MFTPHPNLSDAVNRNIIGSEIQGGVFLDRLQPHSVLQIQTQHRCYTAVMLGGSQALISGHPEYCPQLTLVAIAGSTWGGSMLKLRFVGRGMHLKFRHPEYSTPIVTSRIQEIRECAERAPILDRAAQQKRTLGTSSTPPMMSVPATACALRKAYSHSRGILSLGCALICGTSCESIGWRVEVSFALNASTCQRLATWDGARTERSF